MRPLYSVYKLMRIQHGRRLIIQKTGMTYINFHNLIINSSIFMYSNMPIL